MANDTTTPVNSPAANAPRPNQPERGQSRRSRFLRTMARQRKRVEDQTGERYPSGKRKRRPKGHAAAGTMWQRIQAQVEFLKEVGLHPDMGTILGRLVLEEKLSVAQAGAAIRYGELAGRYDHYHGTLNRTARSPSYERGFSYDQEVEKHRVQGTIKDYERRARRAKKQWKRVQDCMPNDRARDVIEDLCVRNIEVGTAALPDLCKVLDKIAKEFGFNVPNQKKGAK